ncbi:hypothetical protein GCM10010172_07260 [Paractinoplanes ferrugineus]|uniref:Uncharacterized protein n=1 Tax=Paractinoplanes ferrugineus TaxID=113564 RepID=A0A919J935_9ACTN|nr:hypothetical protein [Actinoplanes ferrugineus]GIE16795.1 hypothetical protein Afe05nite_86350 [Actinoplanes ferrugineus]
MIRIIRTDGTSVTTTRHTVKQVLAAKDRGVGILVGGPEELSYADVLEGAVSRPEHTLLPTEIASVEEAA